MTILSPYPGTPEHQKLLQTIVSYYKDDPRILAIIVFGSLGRGDWDPYSDLDLDIIIRDDVQINMLQELDLLFHLAPDIDAQAAMIIPHGEDAADVVLASLMEFSLRYHTLMSTSPNIIESLKLLWGHIDEDTIKAAGLANRQAEDTSADQLINMCVRYALETDIVLQRRQLWSAIELEHRIRGLLMQLFAQSQGNPRPIHGFQKEADAALQTLLSSTLPQYDLLSIQQALLNLLDILEHDLGLFSSEKVLLPIHQDIIEKVRTRQHNIDPDGM